MKKFRILSYLWIALAILLSDIMCAVVAYQYCELQWGGRYEAWSAPARVAFLLIIPFAVGIVGCLVLAWVFYRKKEN